MSGSSTPHQLAVTFGNITTGNVHQLRKMNSSIFPVRYHDSFYADVPDANPDFNQFGEGVNNLIIWHGKITCFVLHC